MSVKEVREPTFLILAALARERMHGYAIIRDAEELSGGRVRLHVGTLYAALDRLSADGHVALDGEEVVNGRLRRYYALTDEGAAVLAEAAARMERSASEAQARLRAQPRLTPAIGVTP